ncbi:MAG: hypothetical protein MGF17_15290 [Trichodesmium sp. MAG_R04]|nr:hypothetical protein [Trichodesmium sp. MAG_R04]
MSPKKVPKPSLGRSQIGIFGEVYYGQLDHKYLWMRMLPTGRTVELATYSLETGRRYQIVTHCDALHQFYGVVVTWVLESPL